MPSKEMKGLMPISIYQSLVKAAAWLEKVESAQARESNLDTDEVCDIACPGWGVFDTNRGMGREIECCDSCKKFLSDEGATNYVMHKLGEEMMRRNDREIALEEKEEEDLNPSIPQPTGPEVHPIFISDNEVGISVRDSYNNSYHIGRYGVWAERASGRTEVVDTSDNLEELTQKWGFLPVYKIQVQTTPSADAGKTEEAMKHLDREAGD